MEAALRVLLFSVAAVTASESDAVLRLGDCSIISEGQTIRTSCNLTTGGEVDQLRETVRWQQQTILALTSQLASCNGGDGSSSTASVSLHDKIDALVNLFTPSPPPPAPPSTPPAPPLGSQIAKFTAVDAAASDIFGGSTAMSGSTIVLSAIGDDESGSVYLFDTSGNQLGKLRPSDASGYRTFGSSVAIDGSTIVVGAAGDAAAGAYAGAAYIFDTAFNQLAKLTASDAQAGDYFGCSVGISGTTIVVGAYLDDDGGDQAGAVYIFDTSGNQIAKVRPADVASGDNFGTSVAISGSVIAVGNPMADFSGMLNAGSVYLFNTLGTQIARLTASDAASRDEFGLKVAIDGSLIVIGAEGDDDHGDVSGSAYIFRSDGTELVKLTAFDAAAGSRFGSSVGINLSSSTIVVGANREGTAGGAAYIFDTTGTQLAKLTPADGAPNDDFGTAVAVGDSTVVVGSPMDDDAGSTSGSAYLFAA